MTCQKKVLLLLTYWGGIVAPCLEEADALCHKGKISGYYTPGTFQQYALGPAE